MDNPEKSRHPWLADAEHVEPRAQTDLPETQEQPLIPEDIQRIKSQFEHLHYLLETRTIGTQEYEGFSWRSYKRIITGTSEPVVRVDLFREIADKDQPLNPIQVALTSSEREILGRFDIDTEAGLINNIVGNTSNETIHAISLQLKKRMERKDLRMRWGCITTAVGAAAVLYTTLGLLSSAIDDRTDEPTNYANDVEYIQRFDDSSYVLDVPTYSEPLLTIPEISAQAFESIPDYQLGDDLSSPRIYKFTLKGESCKTFSLPYRDTHLRLPRLAVKQGEHYNDTANFGVISNQNTLSICRTNPKDGDKDYSLKTPHMKIAVQLPDLDTALYYSRPLK